MAAKESILCRTNQAWKYSAMVLLNLVAVLAVVLHIFGAFGKDVGISESSLLVILFSSLFIGQLFAFKIKCPKCKAGWWLHLLKSPTISTKERDFRKLKNCPLCGYME